MRGGVLTLQGADAEGQAARVTVDRSAFTEPVAAGG